MAGLLRWLSDKESSCQCREHRRPRLYPEVGKEEEMTTRSSILAWKIPWTVAWRATDPGVPKSQTQLSD